MKKVLCWLDRHFEEVLMSVFLCGVVVMMTIHVFFRYVMKSPLTWSEEATRYMFIWFVFSGFSYGIRNKSHIRVNILETFFPQIVPVFSLVQDIVGAAFVFYLLPAGFRVAVKMVERNQISAGLHMPMVFIYGSLTFGLCISAIRIIQVFYIRIRNLTRKNGGNKEEGGKTE